jgi:hypothetical protein
MMGSAQARPLIQPSSRGLGPLAWTCLFCMTQAGCLRGGTQQTRPVVHEDAGMVSSRSAARADAAAVQFSPLLRPIGDRGCPPSFPHGYMFVGTTTSDTQQLFKIIWLDGVSRGDYIVATSPDLPKASAARCVTMGPHRDLNLSGWCCR